MRASTVLVAVGGALALGWGEWLDRHWSRSLVTDRTGGSLAIVVLGHRNRRPVVNRVNRGRVRIALRTVEALAPGTTTLVFSGGPAGASSEARLMAEYARATGERIDRLRVLSEDRSRTTWENVTNVVPLVEHADRIAFASQPAHALKARAYLRRQRPDLATRLVPAADHRFGEWMLVKPLLALHGLWSLRGLDVGD